ncbi:hypothetical protein [Streptomyces mirabilis]|uniref:hypothetical protein n=1 Tax=Streptomyces mirabilis TaxID=68239 RepID=UPI0033B86A20
MPSSSAPTAPKRTATHNRPRTRITVTAVLPEQATAHGIEVKAITVTALPRPRPSESQAKATARHTADHIRQRLLPTHTAALDGPSRTVAPFMADALHRAGLATTEPHGSGYVFFAEPPAEQPDTRS